MDAQGAWPEELPGILWSYRTTYKASTGESPYMLAFGAEAVVPVEIGAESMRLMYFDFDSNQEGLELNAEFVDEMRDQALKRLILHSRRMARYYNSRVKGRQFKVGDLVRRDSTFKPEISCQGKMAAKWEGPYRVTDVLGPATYRLATLDGDDLTHPWPTEHLRKFHP